MVTRYQMHGFEKLVAQGLHPLELPHTAETPIPGIILFADAAHQRLLMLRPDGTTIDLLQIYHLAADAVFNWHKDDKLPHFVGDFGRLAKLAEALHGKAVLTDERQPG